MTQRKDTPAAPETPFGMRRLQVRLGDLGLAPENLRFDEPADDGIPQLADTLMAAGVVIPVIVRAGRKGESPQVRRCIPMAVAMYPGLSRRSRRSRLSAWESAP